MAAWCSRADESPLFVLAASLALFAFLPAPAQARNLECTSLNGGCGALVCVDANLDNTFESNECVRTECTYSPDGCGCYPTYQPCQPPPN